MTARILSTGAYVPETVVPNEALTQFPAASLPLIEQKTGIRSRHYAADDQCTSDLGVEAARACLERAGVPAADLDAIVLATSSPDRIQPATATRVQERLGATRAFAFDVNSVCSGAVYALHVADALVAAGRARRVLVVASEVYSRYLNPRDFSTCPYFGDGAGAVLVGPDGQGPALVRTLLHSDGSGDSVIQVPGGGTMLPFAKFGSPADAYFKMRGREVFQFAVSQGESVVNELLAECGLDRGDVAFVVPHQANVNVLRELAARLRIDFSKFVVNLDRFGNTAAASVLIAFDELLASGRAAPGDAVVLVVFGGGLSWGATLVRI
jgi:3-oxoacyl-[acyl-carrier-protein] synthase III